MKKLISLTFIISILAVLPFINGCKKGAEDPFLSLKSRDGRITRTWVLKEIVEETTEVTQMDETNDINNEYYSKTNTDVFTNNFDGTNLTEETSYTTEDEKLTIQNNPSFTENVKETKSVSYVKNVYEYSVKIQIDDDNTYTATYMKKLISRSTEGSYTSSVGDGMYNYEYEDDTTYVKNDVQEWVEEGDWYWADANDNKVNIFAGPLQGKLLKLSSKEVIIEDITSESDNYEEYEDDDLYTFDDSTDPWKTEDGFVKTITNTTTDKNYKATWEAQK